MKTIYYEMWALVEKFDGIVTWSRCLIYYFKTSNLPAY